MNQAFNPTYPTAAAGRRLEFPVGDLLNPAYAALNSSTLRERARLNEKLVNSNVATKEVATQARNEFSKVDQTATIADLYGRTIKRAAPDRVVAVN